MIVKIHIVALILLIGWTGAKSQTTAFAYQGRLTEGGSPANGNYDLQFALFDSLAGGAQIGSTLTRSDTPVSAGVFNVQLDFGVNAFAGADRFLEISVRPAGVGAFTTLAPRQQISSTPYAIRTLKATTADGLSNTCVECVQDSQINSIAGTKVTGEIPVAGVPPGSGNYIQNSTSPQVNANFNISGNGTVGSLTTSGASTFGGIAAPAVAPPNQGRLYFDSATNKLRISENGAAFLDLVGASGVSGSGTKNTLPLWSAGTTLGNSAISQSGTNVGIGTTNPLVRLHVVSGGGIRFEDGTKVMDINAGNINDITARNNSLGLGSQGPDGNNHVILNPFPVDGTPPFRNGNVGIGTFFPAMKLHVVGSGIRFENNGKIMDISAGNINDITARNNSLGLGSQGPDGNNHVILNPFPANGTPPFRNGNVGIGTFFPETKLHVENPGGAEITLRSPNERAILALDSTLAGQRRVWTLESGIFGTPGLFGIYDRTAGRARLTIDPGGTTGVDVLQIRGGSDFSENFDINAVSTMRGAAGSAKVKAGMVVSIDLTNASKLVISTRAYDRRVAGIISGAGGIKPGMLMGQMGTSADGKYPVSLSGRVYCWADASHGAIRPGDLLTTSNVPGYAMKVTNQSRARGAIIGKAMTALKRGTGLVLVLVSLQ